jgi:phosphoribosylformylglycinamidine synthase
VSGELLALLSDPTIADKAWVSRQYDHQLFLNTVVGPGGDAAVLRLPGTSRGLALSTDGKGRFARLDPRLGGRLAVLEGARNVACAGARPRALVNCLNFGNPEHPEVMWQFVEVVEGMSEACRALDLPVIGGNVSFYNESRGTDIDPTPVVGVLGVIDALHRRPPPGALRAGDTIVLLGETRPELGGSEWATRHGFRQGAPPAADLDAGRALHELVAALASEGAVAGIHDCADGGVAVALAEMAITGSTGFGVAIGDALACFSESASRVVCSVAPADVDRLLARAAACGVAATVLGEAGGPRLVARDAFDVSLAEATRAWRDAIPGALGLEQPAES